MKPNVPDRAAEPRPSIEAVCSGDPRALGIAQGRALRTKIAGAHRSLRGLEAFRLEQPWYLPYGIFLRIAEWKAMKALAEPVRRIASWIESGDAKALARLPGIGNRAAELIIATLKGKVADLALVGASSPPSKTAQLSSPQRDALEVLVAWGDPRGDAERWLERAGQLHPDLHSPDEWVRMAYRIKTGVDG